jgi:hypothetical protein
MGALQSWSVPNLSRAIVVTECIARPLARGTIASVGLGVLRQAMILAATAGGLLSQGCLSASDDTIDVTFDPCTVAVAAGGGTAAAEIDAIDAGLQLWNGAANLTLTRWAGEDEPHVVVRFEDAPLAFRGVYDDERGVVIVNRRLSDGHERAVTVAHELGHAFGLPHVDASSRRSLMNPGNVAIEPTADDVTELRSRWGACAQP